jgi:hypothetical protein
MRILRTTLFLSTWLVQLPSYAACADIDCSCKFKIAGIEGTNLLCKATCESAKAIVCASEKAVKEIGNALKDVRTLVETGKCGGDICDAFEATKKFGVDQIQDTGASLKRAGQRFREGKPLDAMWHLHMDFLNNSQENAADAASRSSALQATGAIAAGTFGPGGAAGYSAWLTYNQTKDLGLAIQTGLITGAASFAASAVNAAPGTGSNLPPGTPSPSVTPGQIAVRSVMGGVIAGTAVAAAGGTQADVENAITRGAVAVLVREGYRELTTHELNNKNLGPSIGEGYCLKAHPDSGFACLPNKNAYITGDDGKIIFDDEIIENKVVQVPRVDLTKLDQYRPHVGMWTFNDKAALSERGEVMQLISRIPGWNAMSVAHDQFDILTNPGTGTSIDVAYRVGTIAPFVVLTYEAAGGGVKDMIRSVASDTAIDGSNNSARQPTDRSNTQGTVSSPATSHEENESLPTEITHVVCKKESVEKNFVMQLALTKDGSVDQFGRVCRIDQVLDGYVQPIWHAHFQRHSCASRLNKIVKAQLRQQHGCGSSIGLRQTDIKLSSTR